MEVRRVGQIARSETLQAVLGCRNPKPSSPRTWLKGCAFWIVRCAARSLACQHSGCACQHATTPSRQQTLRTPQPRGGHAPLACPFRLRCKLFLPGPKWLLERI